MSPRSPALIVACVVQLACGRPSPGDEGSETSSGTGGGTGGGTLGMGETSVTLSDPTVPPDPSLPTSSDPSAPTITATTITSEVTSDGDTDFTTGFPPTSTTLEPDTFGETTAVEVCNDPPGQPQDHACADPSGCGCLSDRCFIIPILGGLCGECLDDGDCGGGGCTLPNPVAGLGAVCNKGQPGAGCMSDAVCAAPGADKCGLVFEVPGIISVTTCGECASNADCDANAPNCSPNYALQDFGGTLVCAADGSRADDTGCDPTLADGVALGDKACASGHCATAVVQGVVDLGVCSACSSDVHCAMNQVCSDALVDLATGVMFGARCVPLTCGNDQQDGGETGVDCGGPCLPCVP